jgi:hypothetical protein
MEPDAALKAINNALFPPPRKEGDWLVSGDAYLGLEGARMDLERLGASRVCIRTIEGVQKQLAEVSEILRKAGLQGRRTSK